jgi:hypothetical protein
LVVELAFLQFILANSVVDSELGKLIIQMAIEFQHQSRLLKVARWLVFVVVEDL